MNQISIRNLGPITNIELDFEKNINIIIGPQASGKSTLGKIIYFCKKIRDYYIDFIQQDTLFFKFHPNEIYINFLKYIRKNFMGCFGTTKHMDSFMVIYNYDEFRKITIRLDKGYAIFKFSSTLEASLRESFHAAYQLYQSNLKVGNYDFVTDFTNKIQFKKEINQHFTQVAKEIFCDSDDILYIPAGRSLLSILSEQLDKVDISLLDLPMKDFIDRIRSTKNRFGTKLDTVVEDYLKTVQGQVKNTNLSIAQELIKCILKAEYVNDTDTEKLFFDDKHWVKLIFGSSGQQEALWILLLLFIIILEDKKTFIIIEEPEAHLYPIAQKYIMELMALTMNSSNSHIFITTHSPYILSSTNLLLQSGITENNPAVTNEKPIIRKQLRITPDKINAFKISKDSSFVFTSMIDEDSKMINSLEIDTISEIINTETEKLIDLEIRYDL